MDIDQKERDKKYNLWARKQPTYIALVIPFLLSLAYYHKYSSELSDVKYVVTLLLSLSGVMSALFFFLTFLIRDIGKFFPEQFLWLLCGIPTTELLYDSNKMFSDSRKSDIRQKVKKSFDIDLLSQTDKSKKNKQYKKRVQEAVERIRETTRGNAILFEYECIYGFYRNITAAFLIDLLLMVLPLYCYLTHHNMIEANQIVLFKMAIAFLVVLTAICLILTAVNANRYARRLYVSFLNS